jgi:LysR family transcriptional activator of nhaA
MPENEEKPTAVYAKKVHKGGFDEVNRVISMQTPTRGTRLPNIEFNPSQLLTFLKVVQTGSVTKASEELFIGQPAVSMQIKGLEESLGIALFERLGKRLVLTPAGEIARRYAFQMEDLCRAFTQEIESAERSSRQLIKLGILDGIAKSIIVKFSEHLLLRSPEHRLLLSEGKGQTLVTDLRDHQLDAVILNYSPESASLGGLRVKKIRSFPVGVFAKDKIAIAATSDLVHFLKTNPLILPTYHSRLRGELDRFFAENEFQPQARVEVQDTALQKLLATAGLGLAFLPITKVGNQNSIETQLNLVGELPGVHEDIWLLTRMTTTDNAAERFIWSLTEN